MFESSSKLRIGIIGAGYVGISSAVIFCHIGHEVMVYERDPEKVRLLESGHSHIYEPGLEEILRRVRGSLKFAENVAEVLEWSDIIFVAVGTPSRQDGSADLTAIEEVINDIANLIKSEKEYVIVLKSTVPIGTTRYYDKLLKSRVVAEVGSSNVIIACNPEFLREGKALYDSLYPERIVIGSDYPEAFSLLEQVYRPILDQSFDKIDIFEPSRKKPILIKTDPVTAETIKYASNAFLATKISFMNEIAWLCEKFGADVTQVSLGVGLDSRIGPEYLKAGIGWGGSCLPKDTAALLWTANSVGCEMPILKAVRQVNYTQRVRFIEKLKNILGDLEGKIIGVLGLSFKPNTDDVRESPAIDIIRILLDHGAKVRAHDPLAMENAKNVVQSENVEFCSDIYELVDGLDALILATEWPDYEKIDFTRLSRLMRNRIILDGRNMFDKEELERLGFLYRGVGR